MNKIEGVVYVFAGDSGRKDSAIDQTLQEAMKYQKQELLSMDDVTNVSEDIRGGKKYA